jgi:hypothetical protein
VPRGRETAGAPCRKGVLSQASVDGGRGSQPRGARARRQRACQVLARCLPMGAGPVGWSVGPTPHSLHDTTTRPPPQSTAATRPAQRVCDDPHCSRPDRACLRPSRTHAITGAAGRGGMHVHRRVSTCSRPGSRCTPRLARRNPHKPLAREQVPSVCHSGVRTSECIHPHGIGMALAQVQHGDEATRPINTRCRIP